MSKLIVEQSKPVFRDDYAVGIYANANDAWQNLYYGLNKDGAESSPRGIKVRETLGCNIYLLNPRDNLVFNSFRKASPYYIAQEFFWYLSGDRDVKSISKYAKFWEKIANPDGTVNSNYGAYIFNKDYYPINGMSQWDNLIETLKKDPDSRQAILQIPITPFKGTKDVCCTSSLQFFIRDNTLFMTTYMRSNDVNKGFCNDIPYFTSLQITLANILNVKVGWYRHVVGSLHVYESDFVENCETEDKKFMYEFDKSGFDYSDYDFYKDYLRLRDHNKDDLVNPILKYMADNKDGNKNE